MPFKIIDMDSLAELTTALEGSNKSRLTLDSGNGTQNRFLLVESEFSNIAFACYDFGVPPHITEDFIDGKPVLLACIGSEIVCIAMTDLSILWRHKVDSVLFYFENLPTIRRIILIEEAGVISLNYRGEKMWEFSTEIIADYKVESSGIFVRDIDGREYHLSTGTGAQTEKNKPGQAIKAK